MKEGDKTKNWNIYLKNGFIVLIKFSDIVVNKRNVQKKLISFPQSPL